MALRQAEQGLEGVGAINAQKVYKKVTKSVQKCTKV